MSPRQFVIQTVLLVLAQALSVTLFNPGVFHPHNKQPSAEYILYAGAYYMTTCYDVSNH